MTPVCIRCNQPIPQTVVAEPVMAGRLLGMRAQHPADVEGKGCQIIASDYPEGYLWYLYEQAEKNPFPPYRKWRSPAAEDPA